MPLTGRASLAAAALVAAGWIGAGVPVSRDSFTGHMALHLLVVTAASPLLALAGIAGIVWLERRCPAGTPRSTTNNG